MLVSLVNVCINHIYFIPPVVVFIFLAFLFFLYAKEVMIACKQIDLKNKSPIFSFYNETITGLIQIKILNRRQSLISQFATIVNSSIRASTSFDLVSRGFGFYAAIIAMILMLIGLMLGVSSSNH